MMAVWTTTSIVLLLILTGCSGFNDEILRSNYGVLFTRISRLTLTPSRWYHVFVIKTRYDDVRFRTLQQFSQDVPRSRTQFCQNYFTKHQRSGTNPFTSLCEISKNYVSIRTLLQQQILNKLSNINQIYPPLPSNGPRRKRGLFPFLGDMQAGLYGLVTDRDFNALKTAVSKLKEFGRYTKDHLIRVEKELQSATVVLNDRLDLTQNELNLTKDFIVKELSELSDHVTESFVHMTKTMVALTLYNNLGTDYLTNILGLLTGEEDAILTLLYNRLPLYFVTPTMLSRVLSSVGQILKDQYPGFRILHTNPSHYYAARNVFSYRDDDNIYIQVPIDIDLHFSEFSLYTVTSFPLPVTEKKGATRIDLRKEFFAISEDGGKYYLELDSHEYLSCKSDFYTVCPQLFMVREILYPSCSTALFFNRVEEIKSLCSVSYLDGQDLDSSVISLAPSRYLISSPNTANRRWTVQCVGRKTYSLDLPALSVISVPCSCYLHSPGIFVPSNLQNCSHNSTSYHSSLNLPALFHLYQNLTTAVDNLEDFDFDFSKVSRYDVRIYDKQFDDIVLQQQRKVYNFTAIMKNVRRNITSYASKADRLLDTISVFANEGWEDYFPMFVLITFILSALSFLACLYLYYKVFCTGSLMAMIHTAHAISAESFQETISFLSGDVHEIVHTFLIIFVLFFVLVLAMFLYHMYIRLRNSRDCSSGDTVSNLYCYLHSSKYLIKIWMKTVPFSACTLKCEVPENPHFPKPRRVGLTELHSGFQQIKVVVPNSTFVIKLKSRQQFSFLDIFKVLHYIRNPICFRIIAKDSQELRDLFTYLFQQDSIGILPPLPQSDDDADDTHVRDDSPSPTIPTIPPRSHSLSHSVGLQIPSHALSRRLMAVRFSEPDLRPNTVTTVVPTGHDYLTPLPYYDTPLKNAPSVFPKKGILKIVQNTPDDTTSLDAIMHDLTTFATTDKLPPPPDDFL